MKILTALKTTSKKGFTLIELLVVIGILGILAAALVATIDPFEQLKKAQDTTTTNILTEFLTSVTRYYTSRTAYPWDTAANGGADCNTAIPPVAKALAGTGSTMGDCIDALIADNELKAAFKTAANLKYVIVTQDTVTNQTVGCFNPQSKSLLHNLNTHYDINGDDNQAQCATVALKDANPTSCYWCTR